MPVDEPFLRMLRCPGSGQPLELEGNTLVADGARYPISPHGIPLLAPQLSDDARRQQRHYEHVAGQYMHNLHSAATRGYARYLDEAFLDMLAGTEVGDAAEICCGAGEAFALLGNRVRRGVGVDVSISMLEAARERFPGHLFVQGDATCLPLADAAFDTAFMLGGIHHVNDRMRLFDELFRILRPGGRFFWREPVNDWWLWRWMRAAIYRLSSALDEETERPLRFFDTVPPLRTIGFRVCEWKTYGAIGYCLFMNSDVLVFNRLLQLVPGIERLAYGAAQLDDLLLRNHPRSGLLVFGYAERP